MGVNEQLVIMVGYNIGQDAYDKAGGFEKFEEYALDTNGKKNTGRIAIIMDGMCGDYCFVGIPIFVSEKYEPIQGLEILKIKSPDEQVSKEIKEFLKEKFDYEIVGVSNYAFIHYT